MVLSQQEIHFHLLDRLRSTATGSTISISSLRSETLVIIVCACIGIQVVV
jgi:hypothetical protein